MSRAQPPAQADVDLDVLAHVGAFWPNRNTVPSLASCVPLRLAAFFFFGGPCDAACIAATRESLLARRLNSE